MEPARKIFKRDIEAHIRSQIVDGETEDNTGELIGEAVAAQIRAAYEIMRRHDIERHVGVFLDEQTSYFMRNLELLMHQRGQCIHWLMSPDTARRIVS